MWRNGAGDYTITFTSALANANYVPLLSIGAINTPGLDGRGAAAIYSNYLTGAIGKTTTTFRFTTGYADTVNGMFDNAEVNAVVF